MNRAIAVLFGVLAASSSAVGQTPPSPEVAVGVLDQQTLPALSARKQAAVARATAAGGWFDGAATLETAWPDLADLALEDPHVVQSKIGGVEARLVARAAERVAPIPRELPTSAQTTLRAARAATLDAEDHADAQDLRLLFSIRSAHKAAPGLTEPAVGEQLRALGSLRARLTTESDVNDPDSEDAGATAEALAQAEADLRRYIRAAIRASAISEDTRLEELVTTDHARLKSLAPGDLSPTNPAVIVADRIERALPLLQQPTRAEIEQTLRAHQTERLRQQVVLLSEAKQAAQTELEQIEDTPLSMSVEAYGLAAAQAQREADAADRRHSELRSQAETASSEIDEMHRQVAALEHQVHSLRAEAARRLQARAGRADTLGLAASGVSDAAVEAARAAAEQAREAAETAGALAEAEAKLVEQQSAMSETVLSLLQQRKQRSDEATAKIDDLDARLGAARSDYAEATRLPPLARERSRRLSAAYVQVSNLVREAQQVVSGLHRGHHERTQTSRSLMDPFPDPDPAIAARVDPGTLAGWRDTKDTLDEEFALAERTDAVELAAAIDILDAARAARRSMRADASSESRQSDSTQFFSELHHEFLLLPVRVEAWWDNIEQNTNGTAGLTRLTALIRGSFEFVVLGLLWLVGRRRIAPWVESILATSSDASSIRAELATRLEDRGWMVSGDARLASPLLTRCVSRLLDTSLAYLTGRLLWEDLRVVAVALFVASLVQLWRLAADITELALVTPLEQRPGLYRAAPAARELAVTSVRWAFGAFLLAKAGPWFASEVVYLDRAGEVISVATLGLGIGILTMLLYRWEPTIRLRLTTESPSALSAMLTREGRSPAARVAQGAAGLIVLAERATIRVAGRLVETRAGLTWLSAALARQRLKDVTGPKPQPLAPDLHSQLLVAYAEEPPREAAAAALQASYERWEHRLDPCLVAVVGHRGEGKTRLLHRFGESLDGKEVLYIAPDDTTTDADEALAWLARSLNAVPEVWPSETQPRAEVLIRELKKRPRTVIVIDEMHNLFLRTVGGFDALRWVLEVLQATVDSHLWICAFHRPAWQFLEGVSERVNLAVFRQRVILAPLAPPLLAQWLESQTNKLGYELDYSPLIKQTVPASEHERARTRARTSFWRILADESHGNPRIARQYWLSALHESSEASRLRVALFDVPRVQHLSDLTPRDLFLLAAVVLHDGLSVNELQEVLNLSSGVCRAVARRLEARGVLTSVDQGDSYALSLSWRPVVLRLLHSKQFLHEGA